MTGNNFLHIISLTIPYPPNYGGVIDIWYKLKALHNQGIRIILHCYEYNRKPHKILEKYCEKVFYYPRKKTLYSLFSTTPFIIQSRKTEALINNLTLDNHPVLIEGVHSMWVAEDCRMKGRKIWLRTHNVEFDYFKSLFKVESTWWKKGYFYMEMLKLKFYEQRPFPVNGIFCIAPNDKAFFSRFNNNCTLITPFHGHHKVTSTTGPGKFILYHADLSVGENQRNGVFVAKLSIDFPLPLIIAGKSPGSALKQNLSKYTNVEIREDLAKDKMDELVKNAAVILLPANQTTGFRLKLLTSLYTGRHIVASPEMVENTGLEHLCHVAWNHQQWISVIRELAAMPFDHSEKKKREDALANFSDAYNARKITGQIL
jgi:hypothetical protein